MGGGIAEFPPELWLVLAGCMGADATLKDWVAISLTCSGWRNRVKILFTEWVRAQGVWTVFGRGSWTAWEAKFMQRMASGEWIHMDGEEPADCETAVAPEGVCVSCHVDASGWTEWWMMREGAPAAEMQQEDVAADRTRLAVSRVLLKVDRTCCGRYDSYVARASLHADSVRVISQRLGLVMCGAGRQQLWGRHGILCVKRLFYLLRWGAFSCGGNCECSCEEMCRECDLLLSPMFSVESRHGAICDI
jgi:hypothetical protein